MSDTTRFQRALAVVAATLDRQREAAIAGDAAGLNRAVETLAQLMVELDTLVEELPAGPQAGAAEALEALRNQVWVNEAVSRNGIAITDHWVGVAAESNRLFHGVA